MLEKLYKGVRLYAPESELNGKLVDVKVSDGNFSIHPSRVKQELYQASPAWVDFMADFADPGHEHRETLQSGMAAAYEAGYFAVGISPLNEPKTESKQALGYFKNADTVFVKALPYATLSKNAEGKHLNEILDLNQHGAVGFYDGKTGPASTFLSKALMYSSKANALVVMHPGQVYSGGKSSVNESLNGVLTGLKTTPALDEYSVVQQAIDVLAYTGGRLHLHLISCKESVEHLREAKKKGLKITASVAYHHLIYTDAENLDFDSHKKVWPPLRSKEDKEALLNGVLDGSIDVICSDHKPVDVERKACEYGAADEGISGIEHMPHVLHAHFAETNYWPAILHAISSGPAHILGVDVSKSLNLWFAKGKEKILEQGYSLSANSPYIGQKSHFDLIERLRN